MRSGSWGEKVNEARRYYKLANESITAELAFYVLSWYVVWQVKQKQKAETESVSHWSWPSDKWMKNISCLYERPWVMGLVISPQRRNIHKSTQENWTKFVYVKNPPIVETHASHSTTAVMRNGVQPLLFHSPAYSQTLNSTRATHDLLDCIYTYWVKPKHICSHVSCMLFFTVCSSSELKSNQRCRDRASLRLTCGLNDNWDKW